MLTSVDTSTVQQNTASDNRTRVLLLAVRQALLIALGALEDYLGVERSVIPRHKRG